MKRLQYRDHLWPAVITAALLGNVVLGITLMRVAAADPHFAVEPDYYRRAVGWDTTQAQAREARELGWRVMPALGPLTGDSLPLTLMLTDAVGMPLDGATLTVEARAVAHASEVHTAALTSSAAAGIHTALLPIRRPGLWELRVVAVRGDDRLATQLRLDAHPDRPARVVTARPGRADPERLAAGMRPE